jgi:CRP/FNR family transcriptional regulator, cyclic AMP receptor protein
MRKVLHLLSTLSDEDVEWLSMAGRTTLVPRDTVVIREGEPLDSLFILIEGKLSVRTTSLGGREVAELYPGEVLGEISFVDARAPSASVVAERDCHLFAISRVLLTKRLTRDEGFAARFYRALATFLADRLRTTTVHLGYGKWVEKDETDEVDESALDDISQAARRFDEMLKQVRVN